MVGDIVLEDVYGLDYTKMVNGSGDPYTIGDEFTVGSDAARVAAAAALFPWWIGYCTGTGPGGITRTPTTGAPLFTNAQILATNFCVACHNDSIWETGGGIEQGWYYGAPPLSRANILWPHGRYSVNYSLLTVYGGYEGRGPGNYSPDPIVPSQVSYGTGLEVDHDNWLDDGTGSLGNPERYIFRSVNWPEYIGGTRYVGPLGASGGSGDLLLETYMEGTRISGFYLNGRKAAAPEASGPGGNTYVTTYHCSGIAIWRFGSNSVVENVRADFFNNASFEIASGTPALFINCRGMFNNYASMWIRGDATVEVVSYECDDCPVVFKVEGFDNPLIPGSYVLTPGCTLKVDGLKVETGTATTDYIKGTMIFDGTGWVDATFDRINYTGLNCYPEGLFRVDPFPTGFTGTSSTVSVTGLKIFGFVRTLMHHCTTTGTGSMKWFVDRGDYTVKYNGLIHDFVYNSGDVSTNGPSLIVTNGPAPRQLPVNYKNRQKWLDSPLLSQTWTDTGSTGLPAYP